MHKVLERQLRRHFGSLERVPPQLQPLLDAVDETYVGAERDRELLERSLDITSQEMLQRFNSLRSQDQELQMILDSVPAMILYKDTKNRILRANKVAAISFNKTPEQLAGIHTRELFPEQADAFHKDDLEVINSGKPKLGIIESHPGPEGKPIWIRTDKVPYRDEHGNVVGVLVLALDITDQKVAEERLVQVNKELEELVRFRTQFLNTTAHELRTPLTPIIIQSHLLKDALGGRPRPDHQRGFEILDRNLRRLDGLVRDVLDAARLQAGRLPLHLQRTDLRGLVREAMESVQAQAEAVEISLEFSSDADLPVNVDTGRVSQVLLNLLTNAIKFTPRGGRVSTVCRRSGAHAIVTVQDTGIGIDPVLIGRLFQPFSQLHDTTQFTASGTGLGLYVSRGIIEEHGGQIWCYSAGSNMGCTFSFRLPLADVATRMDAPQPTSRKEPGASIALEQPRRP